MSTVPPPSPGFHPSAPQKGSSKKGCIIAAVVVLFLVIAGCFGACFMAGKNAGRLMAWGLEKMRPQVVAMMDGGADQALRDEFLAEFDAQVATAKELGSAATAGPRMQAIGELMQMLQELMSDQSITADEMERFVAASKQAREAT